MKSSAGSSDTEKTYELPDGNITAGAECFRRPDALFHIGKEILGLFFLWCGFPLFISCWQDLYANVVLLVGTTMFQVIGERVTKVFERVGTIHSEDQGCRSTFAKVFSVDRFILSVIVMFLNACK